MLRFDVQRRRRSRWMCAGVLGILGALVVGCPGVSNPVEYISGSTGERDTIGDPSVQIFSPVSNLAIGGGTPVEVSWRAVAPTSFSVVDVFFDVDTNPDNGNEIVQFEDLPLTQTSALLDTSVLDAGTYSIGVRVQEVDEFIASGYAGGTVTINQAPRVFFNSPRDNLRFDRSPQINPAIEVDWTVSDPDSTVFTSVFLDPDSGVNGNEILLRESTSQTGDSFTFDLPTATFAAGTYRIVIQVSDGVNVNSYYAPGSILLRARLSGAVDLRSMHLPTSEVRGAIFEGFNPRDNAGSFVTGLRDVDGDGFDDFLVLAQFAKPNYESGAQGTGVGEAYLIYGRSDRFTGLINLNSTGTLYRGSIFLGVPQVPDPIRPSRGITSFTLLTDWDLDGVREMAFGLPFTDSVGVPAPLDPSGFFRTGAVVVLAGHTLRPDIGFPGRDVLDLGTIGTLPHVGVEPDPECPEGFASPKYAAVSGSGPQGTTLFHAHLADDPGYPSAGTFSMGCRFTSNDFGDSFGESVSAWDFHSLVISAPDRDPAVGIVGLTESIPGAGMISVYFNATYSPFYPWSSVNSPAPSEGFDYAGVPNDPAGVDVLPHGGPYHYVLDDARVLPTSAGTFVDAAPGYWVDVDDSRDTELGCTIDSSGFFDNTLTLWSDVAGARLSNARGIGDLNSDGLYDLLIGAPFAREGAGTCFIVLGRLRDLMAGAQLNLSELAQPMDSSDPDEQRILDGIQIVGSAGERLGQAQDDAGDFNNDGLADVVIGSPLLNNRRGGAAVFFGSRDVINLTHEEIPFDELAARGLGVVFTGLDEGDLVGARVASAGDVDGDGNTDLLIAAPQRSVELDTDLDGTIDVNRTHCGVVYLIYGSPDLRGVISLGDIGSEQLPGTMFIGRNSGDQLGAALGEHDDRSYGIAAAGDVDGDGRDDLLFGSVAASPRDRARAGEAYLVYGVGE